MNSRNKRFGFLVILLIGVLAVFKFTQGGKDPYGYDYLLRHEIVDYLAKKLVFEKYVPTSQPSDPSENKAILYVLGGNQRNLTRRCLKASMLYHQGLSKKILILSRSGNTEFSHTRGRNLTNDEWSIQELMHLDVKKEDIVPVSVKTGLFGTLREARGVTDMVRKIGGERLILVTSSYHTRRAFLAFSFFQKLIPGEIYVYGAEDDAGMIYLLSETVKLFLYETVILPACGKAVQSDGCIFNPGGWF